MRAQAGAARVSTAWIVLFTVVSCAATLALACATPFAALAAVAATRMRARDGVLLMLAVWIASQAIGFCVLEYPRDPTTLAWGIAIGTAALAAFAGARWGARTTAGSSRALQVATAFGVGFVAYKLALLCWSLSLGGFHTALSPYYAAKQFVREAAFVVGLVALHRALLVAGVPAPRLAAG